MAVRAKNPISCYVTSSFCLKWKGVRHRYISRKNMNPVKRKKKISWKSDNYNRRIEIIKKFENLVDFSMINFKIYNIRENGYIEYIANINNFPSKTVSIQVL